MLDLFRRRRPPLPTGSFGPTNAVGTITAAQGAVTLSSPEQGTVVCQIGGTWVAGLLFEGTVDPVNQGWATVRANQVSADALVTVPPSNGIYILPGGMQLRVRATAFTSGSVAVNFLGSPGSIVSLPVSGVGPGGGGVASTVRVEDGITTNLATVAQFHNADNQRPGATAFGLLTGGVAQLLNAQQGLDRQEETGRDNITSLGVATGTQQLKSPISTTVSAGGGAGSTSVTLAATKFTNRGANAWIGAGTALTFEAGTTNQETAVVTAVNYGTNVVTIWVGSGVTNTGLAFTHGNGSAVAAGAYNEARDATTPDGSSGVGFAAGATYLFNTGLNAGSGGWESERSFSGELAGATGTGTAIAQEYEDTAGGPVLASGLASGLRLMPAQSLQGKGRSTATITATTAGNTSIVFASAAATNLTLAGWPITLSGSGVTEVVFATTSWVPGSSATLPLQSPVVNTGQTTAAWNSYLPNGPALLGFLPDGVGIEEEALYNPVDGLYYIERAHTQDAIALANVVSEGVIVVPIGGTTGQRLRGNSDGTLPTGGFTSQLSTTLTRPANTVTYTANTAVANAIAGAVQLTFANASRVAALSGWIIGATILDEANQSLKGQFELWVFNTTLGTVINDDANWAPANADLSNLVGVIKFDTGTVGNNASGASGNVIFTDTLTKPLPYKLPSGTSLFGQLVVRNAYIPISAEVFAIQLLTSQD